MSECTFNTNYSVYTGIFLTDRPVFRLWYGLQETINILEKRHSAWLIQRSKEEGGMFKLPSYWSFQWRQTDLWLSISEVWIIWVNNYGNELQLREWIKLVVGAYFWIKMIITLPSHIFLSSVHTRLPTHAFWPRGSRKLLDSLGRFAHRILQLCASAA